jgi:DNA-binding LytR/AlgR family response regulator
VATVLVFLRQPYPRTEAPRRALIGAVLIGAFVGLFLLLFQPFRLDDWETPNKTGKVLGFGFVTFLVLVFDSVLLPGLFPRFFAEKNWTVGREMLLILSHILLISFGNVAYLNWVQDSTLSLESWLWMLSATLLIGIFPTVGVVLVNYIVQLRRYAGRAQVLSARLPPINVPDRAEQPNEPMPTYLALMAENEKDSLTLDPAKWLAIESSDNYCTVYFWKNGTLAKELMRSSLSRLDGQLKAQLPPAATNVPVRCHRSYVVNMGAVERVSGNAQGYKLHLAAGQLIIPVARKYNDTLVKGMMYDV